MKYQGVSQNKVFGATLLVAGTTIGAGMLALPLTSAGAGFWNSTILLVSLWAIMCISALIFLEIILKHGKSASIATLAEKAFGAFGKNLARVSIFLLFHALLAAYVTGSSQIIRNACLELGIDLPAWFWSVAYATIFGFFVHSCTQAVDYANRFLFGLKVIIFITMILTLAPITRLDNITHQPANLDMLWLAIPIFFTSFGFHGSLPTLVDYVGLHIKSLRFIIIVGSAIPLVVYFIWQFCTLGALTPTSLSLLNSSSDVSDLIQLLANTVQSKTIHWMIPTFSFLAIATSFLGVAMGLFDATGEAFQKSLETERLAISLRTFVPPLVFAIFYPHGFIMALGYAAIALSVLAILLPVAVAWQWRQTRYDFSKTTYQVLGGRPMLILCGLIGVLVIAIELGRLFF
jgi:tyrosine-specific transport protein